MTATILAAGISGLAYAHSGASGVVKERMDMMGDIGKAMKTIGTMIKGEAAYDAEVAKRAAGEIQGHMMHMADMFPEGSTEAPSEALSAIWENWDEFLALSKELEDDARQLAVLAASAASADELTAQFAVVGKSCGTCHEKFRLKKQ